MQRLAILVLPLALAACAERSDPGRAEADIKALENRWTKAEISRDVAAVRALLASDFTYVGPDGVTLSAEEDLAGITDPKFGVQNYSTTDFRVRVYGDTAVATGVEILTSAHYGDQDLSGRYRVVTVWVKRDGTWRAVHAQETLIREG